ncbi:MAG: hypothetical protein H6618_04780 [Deltaproteobacteria bacterium]|nr:hypothetical protein [Deltaproteobacteria bacterium]
MALNYKRASHFWSRYELAGTDSSTRTSPPDSIFLDRKIESFFVCGGESALSGGNTGIRANLKVLHQIQKGEEEEAPKTPRERHLLKTEPSADITFVNHKGLELFAGLQALAIVSESSEVNSPVTTSRITYSPVTLFAPRAGLIRRGNSWSGGFYYNHWRESTRSFEKVSGDGSSLSGTSYVLIPSSYGIVGAFNYQQLYFEFDIGSVHAGDGGERTEDGNLVQDDYLRAWFSMYLPSSLGGFRSALAWQSISYADNAYASPESIAMTSLRLDYMSGTPDDGFYTGIIFAYGTGGTDITEYKARFRSQALAFSLGLFIPI